MNALENWNSRTWRGTLKMIRCLIERWGHVGLVRDRLDINNPPVATGGIQEGAVSWCS